MEFIVSNLLSKIVLINCKTQKLETYAESSTRDMQTVNVSIAVNYNVNKNTANKLYQEVGTTYEDIIIRPAMLESIKSSMAQYTAEELITKRAEVSEKIKETIIAKVSERGFTITGFNTTDINFLFDTAAISPWKSAFSSATHSVNYVQSMWCRCEWYGSGRVACQYPIGAYHHC